MQTEKNIEQLLKKLSADKKPYPKNLLATRRAAYLSQVTAVVSSGPQLKKGNGQGGSPHASAPMTPLMKVVLTALVAANVALATYLAVYVYDNWDRVQELLFGAPSMSETSPAPLEIVTQAPELETTPEIAVPPEETVAPVSTPEPTSLSEDSQPSGIDSADSPQVSTAEPDGKDQPGLHLGQTPHTPSDPPGQRDQDDNQGDQAGKDKEKKDKTK